MTAAARSVAVPMMPGERIAIQVRPKWRRLLGGMATYVTGESMLRDLVLASMVAVVGTALLEVRHLHNPGAILDYLLGRYRFPVKEHRVFLFADLADSTSIAEHLGDQKYSRFIGDCYRDVAEAILAWSGRV